MGNWRARLWRRLVLLPLVFNYESMDGIRKVDDGMGGLKEMPKVGDELRYIGGWDQHGGVIDGRLYEVLRIEDLLSAVIVDDSGRERFVSVGNSRYELVSKTPQPDVPELLANLGRRLHEVEQAQERTNERIYYDETVAAYADLSEGPMGDAVDSPQHYKRGKFETIEVIEEITQGYDDGFVAHCAGTAIKYIARAPYKHVTPTEDLRKAAKYLEFAIKRLEAAEEEVAGE